MTTKTITMRMAKASERDMDSAFKLLRILETTNGGCVPLDEEEPDDFDPHNYEHLSIFHMQIMKIIEQNPSGMARVIYGMGVTLDNNIFDPNLDYLELHPRLRTEDNVIEWAEERGIFEKATPATQLQKTVEELGELARAISKRDQEGIKDGIGDVIVTLIIQAKMHGLSATDCLRTAFEVIANRKGKMIDGVFVKDADTAHV